MKLRFSCFLFHLCFLLSKSLGKIFLWKSEKSNFKPKISTTANQKKIKSSLKDFSFDQQKTFCENYKPIRVGLSLFYKNAKSHCRSQLFTEFMQTQRLSYLPRQNKFSYLKTACHIKPTFFLLTFLEDYSMRNTRSFYKQRFFSSQPQCDLTFLWFQLRMLLTCYLLHITIIILKYILNIEYICVHVLA